MLFAGLADAAASGLRAGLRDGVRLRREPFGAVAYVPQRDHFFALDRDYAAPVQGLSDRLRPISPQHAQRVTALAEYGICATDPPTSQRAFYGRSQLGAFTGLPTCNTPLVVNCFTTAHCPLRCAYCHADDLMVGYRAGEDERGLREVIRVAAAIPALVGVVTGGEPLSRPDRAERLIAELAKDKAVVLDTSGVGDFPRLLPLLQRYGVHVRVSMDSGDRAVNDALRPINRRYLAPGISAHVHAQDTIRRAVKAGLPCSVQTVVTARNGDLPGLLRLRDLLVELGVTTWALHVVVPAGKAAEPARSGMLPHPEVMTTLTELVWRAAAERIAIDIRVTDTFRAPNSVLLVNAEGELCVEGRQGGGKTMTALPRLLTRRRALSHFRRNVDLAGHASRYLNGALDLYEEAGRERATPTLAGLAAR